MLPLHDLCQNYMINWIAWRTVEVFKEMKRQRNITIPGSLLDGIENSEGFHRKEKTTKHRIVTGWHGEQWDFQRNEKTTKRYNPRIVTGWHGEQ